MEFSNKVVLITGAGRGVGRALAEGFAIQGAIIAANDISPVSLDASVANIKAISGRVKDYVYDIAKKMSLQAMVTEILDDWGRIDVLINNATVEPHATILDMDEWEWRRTLDVNLSGPFFAIQSVGRVMREQGGGVIINIGSITGRDNGLKDRAAYVASKMGLIGLTREAARELTAYNIRVNAICPGIIETEMLHTLRADEAMLSKWMQEIPAGYLGKPENVVDLVLFLCSKESADITGQVIKVDGSEVIC